MIKKITDKLVQEKDGAAMKTAAVSIQQSRVVSCSNVVDECNQYGEFISLAIDVSRDEVITPSERQQLRDKHTKLMTSLQSAVRQAQDKE